MDAIDFLTSDMSFIPTRRQIAFRILLQRRVPFSVQSKLTIGNLAVLTSYCAPYTIEEITAWAVHCPGFFEWMLNINEDEVILFQARQKAAQIISDTLDLPDIDATGKVDTSLRSLKLKAAGEILKDRSPVQHTKTTQNVKVSTQAIPKRLASMSPEQLEAKYLKLEESPT